LGGSTYKELGRDERIQGVGSPLGLRGLNKRIYYIDRKDFSTLDEFFNAISDVLIPGAVKGWIHNLDAFNDLLWRGDDIPVDGFTLHWKNSAVSRENLGYQETVRQLEKSLLQSHPINRKALVEQIELARTNKGETVFDRIIDIIKHHETIHLILE
jgi:RNAse (barnase) inhibitor barstar